MKLSYAVGFTLLTATSSFAQVKNFKNVLTEQQMCSTYMGALLAELNESEQIRLNEGLAQSSNVELSLERGAVPVSTSTFAYEASKACDVKITLKANVSQ